MTAINFPSSPSVNATFSAGAVSYIWDGVKWKNNTLSTKQDTLVSGTNIKTINGTTLLGSGDLTITGGVTTSRYALDGSGSTATTYTYVGGVLTSSTDTIFGLPKTSVYAYNADKTINTITNTYSDTTETLTFTYVSGVLTSYTLT